VLKDIAVTGEGDERTWKLDQGAVQTPWGLATLAGTLDTKKRFNLDARGSFEGVRDDLHYRLAARFGGTLARIEAAFEAQENELRATGTALIEDFGKHALRSMTLHARDVDVGRYAGGQHTRLAIDAALQPAAKGFAGTLKMTNAEPGPIDK